MSEITIEDLAARLDLIQRTAWSTDERAIRNLESIARQEVGIREIKATLDIISEKLDELDKELKELNKTEEVLE